MLSMTELRTSPGEVLDRVAKGGHAFIIERNGHRMACLVPLSAFFPDISPARIAEEISKLERHGEVSRTHIADTRELVFLFTEKGPDPEAITLTIVLPHGYPNRCPRVYAAPLDPATPHRWTDGELCLFGVMGVWNPGKHTVYSTLMLARRWLQGYCSWRSAGHWPSMGPSNE